MAFRARSGCDGSRASSVGSRATTPAPGQGTLGRQEPAVRHEAPVHHGAFPDAQVVHVIRDGRDVAVSHRKRFGYWSCVKSAVKWPRYIAEAREAGRRLPPGQYHELRYEELVSNQEATLRSLLDFLGEEWDPSLLEFDKQSHDVPARYHAQARSRRADEGTSAAVYTSRVGTYRKELDPAMRLLIRLTAGRELKALGYA